MQRKGKVSLSSKPLYPSKQREGEGEGEVEGGAERSNLMRRLSVIENASLDEEVIPKEIYLMLHVKSHLYEKFTCDTHFPHNQDPVLQRQLILQKAVEFLLKTQAAPVNDTKDILWRVEDAWVAHDHEVLNTLQDNTLHTETKNSHAHADLKIATKDDKLLTRIHNYYGSEVALMLAFGCFCFRVLLPVPAFLGVALTILNLYGYSHQESYDALLVLFSVFIVLYSTSFLELWNRRCSGTQ